MIRSLGLIFLLSSLLAGCADIEPETQGVAFVSMRLEQDSSNQRSAAKGITPEEAKTILVVLRPPSQCSSNYGNSTQDMDRALLNLSTQEVELKVPLETQMKLCLYFFSENYGLTELNTGDIEAESFGESDVFILDSEISSATIDVVYWGTFYSTLTAKISSKSSAGVIVGTSGSFKLSDLKGIALKEDNFTFSDNQSHMIIVEELAYGSYTYQVEIDGFSNEVNTFVVSNSEETLDIKLTPNPVDISWISFENLDVAQIGTTDEANASGTLVIKVPLAQQDEVKQIILSTMVVKNSTNSVTINVTPPTNLPAASLVDEEFVHYRLDFAAYNVKLETGSNLFDVIISIGGKSNQVEIGSVSYDACVDANTMCLKLTWSDGSDPDLHSMYWPDWGYTETLGTGSVFDDQNHVYGHPSYQKWLLTGDKVHLEDATTLPTLINASNQTTFTVDAGANTLVLSGSDLADVSVSTPVLLSSDGTLPGGLDAGTIYYLHGIDNVNKTVQLATNSLNAMQGTAVNITDQGSGTHTLTALGAETQVWSTNNGKVGDGTYLVWVEDVSNADLQGVRVELSGPELNPSITHGPFRFKDLDDGVTEAQNLTDPYQQHVFLIQVQNGSIVRSDKIPVGSTVDALKNGLNAEIGNLPASLF